MYRAERAGGRASRESVGGTTGLCGSAVALASAAWASPGAAMGAGSTNSEILAAASLPRLGSDSWDRKISKSPLGTPVSSTIWISTTKPSSVVWTEPRTWVSGRVRVWGAALEDGLDGALALALALALAP